MVKKVHPDLLSKHPLEQLHNSESLKVLNAYVQHLSKGEPVSQHNIRFCTVNAGHINKVEVELPSSGSLSPLFHAFGLISDDEFSSQRHSPSGAADVDFLAWLRGTVSQAARVAEEYQTLTQIVQDVRADIESQFQLTCVMGSFGFATQSTEEQLEDVQALQVLQDCLTQVCQDQPDMVKGLAIQLCSPGSVHLEGCSKSHVGNDGTLYLRPDPDSIQADLLSLDLQHAQQLSKQSGDQSQQVRAATEALKDMLGVDDVWFWSRSQSVNEEFLQWAHRVLEHRESCQAETEGRTHAFRLLVHADMSAPTLEYGDTYGALQVSTECEPQQLIDYLHGEAANAASATAAAQDKARGEEERLLESARVALGAQQIIRVCSQNEHPSVSRPLQQLIRSAAAVKQHVDLSGVTLAIDDCYDVWGSGIISIPWDFSVQDLKPQLLKLLGPGPQKPERPAVGAKTTAMHPLSKHSRQALKTPVMRSAMHSGCRCQSASLFGCSPVVKPRNHGRTIAPRSSHARNNASICFGKRLQVGWHI